MCASPGVNCGSSKGGHYSYPATHLHRVASCLTSHFSRGGGQDGVCPVPSWTAYRTGTHALFCEEKREERLSQWTKRIRYTDCFQAPPTMATTSRCPSVAAPSLDPVMTSDVDCHEEQRLTPMMRYFVQTPFRRPHYSHPMELDLKQVQL